MTNKSFDGKTAANIKIEDGGDYKNVRIYGVSSTSPEVLDITDSSSFEVSDGNISYEMEPKSVSLLVISKEKNSAEVSEIQETQEVQNDPQDNNSNGKIWLIVGALAVVAAGIAVLLKIKKKS